MVRAKQFTIVLAETFNKLHVLIQSEHVIALSDQFNLLYLLITHLSHPH